LHCNVACSLPVGSVATESAYQISEFKLISSTSSKAIHVNGIPKIIAALEGTLLVLDL